MSNKNTSIDLFPVPKPLSSAELPTPSPLPGATPSSTAALREVLQDDFTRHHCFFNDLGFHNHVAHTAIALWYLGADADVIKAAYVQATAYQRPAFTSPGPINKDNWTQHMSDEKYYNAYLAFFIDELAAKGPAAILEEYVFSDAANYPDGKPPAEMLTRFNEGLLHPIIHVGYGFELGLPGMVAEGLAQGVAHEPVGAKLVPARWFKDNNETPANATKHVLDILARVIADPEIGFKGKPELLRMYRDATESFGEKITKHVDAWTPDLSSNEARRQTLEEVVFLVNLIYAVPGLVSKEEGGFNADFFAMHFVTSSMFLSSLLLHLKPKSQELLLRSYVSIVLSWFICRGKPKLNIEAFFEDTESLKMILDRPTVARPALANVPPISLKSSNPWTSVLEETIVHPDDHVPKLQRTLSHYAQVYGNTEPGHFKGVELKGAEKVDGTLFIRAANLTAARLHDGKEKQRAPGGIITWWDRRGFWSAA